MVRRCSRAFSPRLEFPKMRVHIGEFLIAKIRKKRSDGYADVQALFRGAWNFAKRTSSLAHFSLRKSEKKRQKNISCDKNVINTLKMR